MEGQGLNANNILYVWACTPYSVIYWICFLSKGLWAQCYSTDPSSVHEEVLQNSAVLQHVQQGGPSPGPGAPSPWARPPMRRWVRCSGGVEQPPPSSYWRSRPPSLVSRRSEPSASPVAAIHSLFNTKRGQDVTLLSCSCSYANIESLSRYNTHTSRYMDILYRWGSVHVFCTLSVVRTVHLVLVEIWCNVW